MKQRMSTLEVAAEVACLLEQFQGLYLSNIYNINQKTFLLKFNATQDQGGKKLLYLESGIKFYSTKYDWPRQDIPTNFNLKLRKHLKQKRLTNITQMGVDRIVQFTFGYDEKAHHLILELFASGNVVLTNAQYEVLSLLRSHRDDDKNYVLMARHNYPLHQVRLKQKPTRGLLTKNIDYYLSQNKSFQQNQENNQQLTRKLSEDQKPNSSISKKQKQQSFQQAKKNKAQDKRITVLQLIQDILPYGAQFAQQCFINSKVDPQRDIVHDQLQEVEVEELLQEMQKQDQWLDSLLTKPPQGCIIAKAIQYSNTVGEQTQKDSTLEDNLVFQEATVRFQRDQNPESDIQQITQYINFQTFDEAVDEYCWKAEKQRQVSQQQSQERIVQQRFEKIRQDQVQRYMALEQKAQECFNKGTLIQLNQDEVNKILEALTSQLALGIQWEQLNNLIKNERLAGNPIAQKIVSMDLEHSRVVALVQDSPNVVADTQRDEQTLKDKLVSDNKKFQDYSENGLVDLKGQVQIELEIGIAASLNAEKYFQLYKKHSIKHQKTVEASKITLEQAQEKMKKDLERLQRKVVQIQDQRKQLWFEKFSWFITSENYIVISGKDAQQNEILVKKYMRKGDLYLHADVNGASSTIIKNQSQQPVSPISIQQAATQCICRSKAWDQKILSQAWWVYPEQVSKTAPSGEYLVTGSFMIRGKKNYVNPKQLVMGLGLLFRIDEQSIQSHIGERKSHFLEAQNNDEVLQSQLQELSQEQGDNVNVGVLTSKGIDKKIGSNGQMQNHQGFSQNYNNIYLNGSFQGERGEQGNTLDKGEYSITQEYKQDTSQKKKQNRMQQQQKQGAKVTNPEQEKKGQERKDQQGQELDNNLKETPIDKKDINQRASKAKLKKVKEKYQNQDEEDKQMAMQLLGSEGSKKSRSIRVQERKLRKEDKKAQELKQRTESNYQGQSVGELIQKVDQMSMGSKKPKIKSKQIPKQENTDNAWNKGNQQKQGVLNTSDVINENVQKPINTQINELSFKTIQRDRLQEIQTSFKKFKEESENDVKRKDIFIGQNHNVLEHNNYNIQAQKDNNFSRINQVKQNDFELQDKPNQLGPKQLQCFSQENENSNNQEQIRNTNKYNNNSNVTDDLNNSNIRDNNELIDRNEVESDLDDYDQSSADEDAQYHLQDSLTGLPQRDDILLYSLPMCAPYDCLSNYKYKVKLVPGTLKRGKAAKQAIELMKQLHEPTAKERLLINNISDTDLNNNIIGSVKIQVAGMMELKLKQRQAKKTSKNK